MLLNNLNPRKIGVAIVSNFEKRGSGLFVSMFDKKRVFLTSLFTFIRQLTHKADPVFLANFDRYKQNTLFSSL